MITVKQLQRWGYHTMKNYHDDIMKNVILENKERARKQIANLSVGQKQDFARYINEANFETEQINTALLLTINSF